MFPTANFEIENAIELVKKSTMNEVLNALEAAGIQSDGNMLDIMLTDLAMVAEAVELKNERYARIAIERLISFRGFDGTPLNKWEEFSKQIHSMVTRKEVKPVEFLNGILCLDFDVKVQQHPYRTATVYNPILFIDRTSHEGEKLEAELAKRAGAKTDNHTAYTLTTEDGLKAYVSCSDFKIWIGLEIEERNW